MVVDAFEKGFKQQHEQEFGFNFAERPIDVDNIRVRSVGFTQTITQKKIAEKVAGESEPRELLWTDVWF